MSFTSIYLRIKYSVIIIPALATYYKYWLSNILESITVSLDYYAALT